MPARTAVFRGETVFGRRHDAAGRDPTRQTTGNPRPELGRRDEGEQAVFLWHQQVVQAVHGVVWASIRHSSGTERLAEAEIRPTSCTTATAARRGADDDGGLVPRTQRGSSSLPRRRAVRRSRRRGPCVRRLSWQP